MKAKNPEMPFFKTPLMNNLLNKLLTNPQGPALSEIVAFMNTNDGYSDFCTSLVKNQSLSFFFLKQYFKIVPVLCNENFIFFILENLEIFSSNNQFYVLGFLEEAEVDFTVTEKIIIYSIKKIENGRVIFWKVLDSLFRRYRNQERSNKLYTEINASIELTKDLFTRVISNTIINNQSINNTINNQSINTTNETINNNSINNNSINNNSSNNNSINNNSINNNSSNNNSINTHTDILKVFYSLVFQDIHPFFEDNHQKFFNFFRFETESVYIINDIFELFITKYPEFTDFDTIILILSSIDRTDPLIINTLAKAYSYRKTHKQEIIKMLKRIIIERNDYDWRQKTRNMLLGIDEDRGCLYKIIRMLDLDPTFFISDTYEAMLFIASVIKCRDPIIIQKAIFLLKQYDRGIKDCVYFNAFFYLIQIQVFTIEIDLRFIETDLKWGFISFFNQFLKAKDYYHIFNNFIKSGNITNNFNKIIPDGNLVINSQSNMKYLSNVLSATKLIDNFCSEFTSEFLFRFSKINQDLLTQELYEVLTIILKNIKNISVLNVLYIFEVYVPLSIKFGKFNLRLIEYVLEGELLDLYNLIFYYISIAIREGTTSLIPVAKIILNNPDSYTKQFSGSVSCLITSCYVSGIITGLEAITYSGKLRGIYKFIVVYKIRGNIEVPADLIDVKWEWDYLVLNKFDNLYFEENFIDPSYCRLTVKKIIKDFGFQKYNAIIEKNLVNFENEVFPHFACVYFDI